VVDSVVVVIAGAVVVVVVVGLVVAIKIELLEADSTNPPTI
jgi:hypothetical protein